MIHHVSAPIERLLELGNKKLGKMVNMDGTQARALLLQAQAKGDKFIPNDKCDNFDPVKGCLGHEKIK